MDLLLVLALVTFILVIGFLVWNRISTKRRQETGGHTAGLGGPNDPMAGAAEGMRNPDNMRAALDDAASTPMNERQRPRS